MKKTKVMTIIGTRPEIIRLSRVMAACDRYFDHKIIHTGQNYDYELSEIFFKDLGIRQPDLFLSAAGTSGVETVGNILKAMDPVLEAEKPDAVLVLGDTNSCLAAYAAKRHKIPIFHMEAGNRCGDQRVPEEINRKIIDHISDVNMPYSERARDNLIAEGISARRIIKTGSPMKEVLTAQMPAVHSSTILETLNLKRHEYYVVSIHREENVNNPMVLTRLMDSLNKLAEQKQRPIIFSCHPRTFKMISHLKINLNSAIKIMKPLGFSDYLKLQIEAIAVLSDSGTISEESCLLNFPALNLRESHERMEAMEEGAIIMTGSNPQCIFEALSILEMRYGTKEKNFQIPKDYDVDDVSEKVANIILSYIDVVNRETWLKS